MVVGAVAGAVWSYVRTVREPVSYISHARMFVSGRVNVPEASSAYSEELANYLGTQTEIMRSQEVMSRARQRVELEQPGVKGDASIVIRVVPQTAIFSLSASGGNPAYCRALLDALMLEFMQFKRERRMVTSQATIEQISAELGKLEKEIARQEQQMLSFKERNSITYWEQQAVESAHHLAELKSREATLRMRLSVMDTWDRTTAENGVSVAEISATGGVTFAESPELAQARIRLDELTQDRETLLRGLRTTHPKVVRLDEEMSRVARVVNLGVARARAHRKEQRLAAEAELEGLVKSIREYEGRSLESSRVEAEHEKIRTTLDRTRGLYDRLLSSLQNLDAGKGVDQELVQILQAASPAEEVSKALRSRLVSGSFVGMAAGLCLLLLAARLDQRSYTVEETVDRLGCRGFVEVPQLPTGPVSEGRRRFTESVFEESFRRLRSLVYMGMATEPAPIFLVTSALPSEGKSEVALNLARAFARAGKRVLLVDCDLRRGRLHRALAVGAINPGFCELLEEKADIETVLRPTNEPGLSMIAAGSSTSHVNELISTSDITGCLARLRSRFDVVVMDSAPIGPVDDTGHFLPLASRVLFVVRMRHTPLRQAEKAIASVKLRGAVDVGLVFNRVRPEGGRYYYSYHYANKRA
jgi:capsular exopolysaccharide synthesis family protein